MGTYGQHSVARSVTLHLLPGVLIAAFYTLTAPVVRSLEFPSLMATFLYILLVLVPFELGTSCIVASGRTATSHCETWSCTGSTLRERN